MMKIDGWVGCFDEGSRCEQVHGNVKNLILGLVSEYSQPASQPISDNDMLILGSLTCWDKLLVQPTL